MRFLRRTISLLSILAMASIGVVQAQEAAAPRLIQVQHEISGDTFDYEVGDRDTSDSIAAKFGEPELTLWQDGAEPEPGESVKIDNRHVAVAALDEGVVVNIPQRMLFVFREGHLAAAWPITVGRPDWPTPAGSYQIATLSLNPTWHVPPAIRAEMEDEGIPTSDIVAPGPGNPLGKNLIGLNHGGIAIHGTNHPRSIFHFGSHGCIRLAPEAAARLFRMARHAERVEIVYQPVSFAVLPDGEIFVESDADPYQQGRPDLEALLPTARARGG